MDTKPSEKLSAAVGQFFDKVVEDPLLQLYFFETDISRLKQRFALYLAYLVGEWEGRYPGPDILKAHAGREIMDEAADKFTTMLVQTLRSAGVPTTEVDLIERKLVEQKLLVIDKVVTPDTHVYRPNRMG